MIIPTKPTGRMINYHFRDSEFTCRHCGMVMVHPELIRKLELLRAMVDRPITITSGYRCQAYQKVVNPKVPVSPHMFGMAADIMIKGLTVDAIANRAEIAGFDGIGRYYGQKFVHVDVCGSVRRWAE